MKDSWELNPTATNTHPEFAVLAILDASLESADYALASANPEVIYQDEEDWSCTKDASLIRHVWRTIYLARDLQESLAQYRKKVIARDSVEDEIPF